MVTDLYAGKLLIIQVSMLLPTLLYYLAMPKPDGGRRSFGEFLRTLRIRPIRLSVLLCVAVAMLLFSPCLTFLNVLSQLLSDYNASESIIGEFENMPFVVSFLAVAVLPALVEETVFRGVAFGQYRKHSILLGACLSGVMFGLMHGNLNQMMYAFAMGILFAYVDEITGSTVSSMVMHLLVNGTSVVLVYIMPDIEEAESQASVFIWEDLVVYGVFALLGGILGFELLRWLARRYGVADRVGEDWHKPGKWRTLRDMITSPLVLYLALLVGLIVITEVVA